MHEIAEIIRSILTPGSENLTFRSPEDGGCRACGIKHDVALSSLEKLCTIRAYGLKKIKEAANADVERQTPAGASTQVRKCGASYT